MRRAPPSPRPAARGILCVAARTTRRPAWAVRVHACLLRFALPFTLVVAGRPASGAAPESAPRCVLSAHPPRRRPQPVGLVSLAYRDAPVPSQRKRRCVRAPLGDRRWGAWDSVCSGAGALAGPEGEKRRQAVEFVRRPSCAGGPHP